MFEVLRERIEVIITKEDKILIQETHLNKGVFLTFPGGGLDNLSLEEAAYKEVLEEIGIAIKNINVLKYNYKSNNVVPGDPKIDWREKRYNGSITYFCTADFDKYDDSLFNIEQDGTKYFFVTPHTAISLFSLSDTRDPLFDARFNALKEVYNKFF